MRSALASAVALYVATALVACLLLWALGDQSWIATPLLFGGRWVLLLPLLALVPLAARRRRHRRLLLPLAVAALVVLGPFMGGETGWRRLLPTPAGMPLRIVTYNVGGADDGAVTVAFRLRRLLAEWRPDVVAFQECGYLLMDQVRRVEGWSHAVVGELCLLSRHPIADVDVLDRETLSDVWRHELGLDGGGQAVRYTLATPRGPVPLAHVHLETPREGVGGGLRGLPSRVQRNIALRDLESMLARSFVEEDGARRIVVGDFNMPVESRIFRTHWGDLTDAFSAAGVGWGATRYAGWIRARIDHVLVDDAWHVRAARVVDPMALDHGAVIADLVLPDA